MSKNAVGFTKLEKTVFLAIKVLSISNFPLFYFQICCALQVDRACQYVLHANNDLYKD